jgi:hypothetical protein
MWVTTAETIIPAMTRPVTSPRVLLVAERRSPSSESSLGPIRRYRLARLRFDGRAEGPASRFEHLKRVYD